MGGDGFHGTHGIQTTDGFHGTGEVPMPADGHPVPIHHVNGYFRSTPDGGTTYVQPHVATNPDGIVENNLSWHGPHPAAGPEGTPQAPSAPAIRSIFPTWIRCQGWERRRRNKKRL